MKSMRHRTTFLAFAVMALAVSFGANAAPLTEPIEDVVTMHASSPAEQATVERTDYANAYVINAREDSRVNVVYLVANESALPMPGQPLAPVVAGFGLPSTGRLPLPDNPRLFPPTPTLGIGLS
ncbi:MAG: hypothetical protein ACRC6L_12895 [Steroidobacteraceae bacterium]